MFREQLAGTSTMARRLGIALCGLAIACGIQQARAAIPDTERAALIDFYNSTNGANWTRNDNWLGPPGTECTWWGVTCRTGHVVELNFRQNNNLTGTLPSWNGLPRLSAIRIVGNHLSGSIPPVNNLQDLLTFDLQRNGLVGSLPSISGLTRLIVFNVDEDLTGTMPEFSNLPNLTYFGAANNHLEGPIPALNTPNLEGFWVFNNVLDGPLPDIASLANLREFDVRDNHLSGQLPDLSAHTSLQVFSVGNNNFDGPIPSLTGLSHLWIFSAPNNNLTGVIPSLAGLSALIVFDTSHNHLTGAVPSNAGLPDIDTLYVNDNQLSGALPEFGPTNTVMRFRASGNNLSGTIPGFDPAAHFTEFVVDHNQLSGAIPKIEEQHGLKTFKVDHNLLSGALPTPPTEMMNWASDTSLCPNYLDPTDSALWDAITGITPWYQDCAPLFDPGLTVSPVSIYSEVSMGDHELQILTISDDGNSDVHWTLDTAESDCSAPSSISWLTLDAAAGTVMPGATYNVVAALQTDGLASATYSALICVHSDDADHPEVEVPVTLVVIPHQPNELLNPTSFSVEAMQGASVSSTLTVANAGNADLNWTLSTTQNTCGAAGMVIPWIQLDPVSGTTAANESDDVGITFDAGSLAAATYTASLCVESDDPDHAQVEIPVTFTVDPAMPIARVDPTSFDVTTTTGSLIEASLSIENTGTADLHWNLSTAKEDCAAPGPVSWIVNAQEIGTVSPGDSRSVVIGFDATNVPPGSFSAELCLSSDDPDHPMITMPVGFTVNPVPLGDAIYVNGFDGPGLTPIGHH